MNEREITRSSEGPIWKAENQSTDFVATRKVFALKLNHLPNVPCCLQVFRFIKIIRQYVVRFV